MKKIPFLAFIFLLGLLQTTFLNYFRIFNVQPDLLLISAVIVSLVLEFRWAIALSIFAGIIKDIFGAGAFGINTLLFGLWSFLIMRLARELTIDITIIRMLVIFIIAIMHNIIMGLVLISSGNVIPLGIFLKIVVIGSIYSSLALPLVFKMSTPIVS